MYGGVTEEDIGIIKRGIQKHVLSMSDVPLPVNNDQSKIVEVNVVDISKQPVVGNNNVTGDLPATNSLSATLETDVLKLLTEVGDVNEGELGEKYTELLGYLGKLIELLKEKSNECLSLEKQNAALTQQSKSLKEVVTIVKDLLNIRNMELSHLQQDISAMQDKINNERSRQNSVIEKMDRVQKLNKSLKEEYAKQYSNFERVRTMYEEKVSILIAENKRLQNLSTNTEENVENVNQVNEQLSNITLALEAYPPFDDTINENVEK